MKTFMLALLTINLLAMEAYSETVSKEDLRLTVLHMQKLAKEGSVNLADKTKKLSDTQSELQKVQKGIQDLNEWGIEQQTEALKQTERADKEHAQALENGRERDVFVFLFAAMGAVATIIALVPTMNRVFNLQFPWTIIAPIAGGALVFALYFGLLRLALYKLIHIL